MAKSVPTTIALDTSNFVSSLFIIAFLCVGFIPNLEAVDKIAPQWLYLSILNFLCAIFLYSKRKNFQKGFEAILTSAMSWSYIGFVLWAGMSYFYAINPIEVIVNIVQYAYLVFIQ